MPAPKVSSLVLPSLSWSRLSRLPRGGEKLGLRKSCRISSVRRCRENSRTRFSGSTFSWASLAAFLKRQVQWDDRDFRKSDFYTESNVANSKNLLLVDGSPG